MPNMTDLLSVNYKLFRYYVISLVICINAITGSQLIPGPGAVVFNDGNETITVDFSDIEFYPVESFPLFTSAKPNASEGESLASRLIK